MKLIKKIKNAPIIKPTIMVLDSIIGDFVRHDGLMYAGSLSFFLLFSSVPILVLFAAIIGYVLYFLGNGDPALIQKNLEDIARYGQQFFPFFSDSLQEDLFSLIKYRARLGISATVVLLLSASQLFRAIEYSVVRVLSRKNPDSKQKKSKIFRNPLHSKIIFGGFLLILAATLLALQFLARIFYGALKELMPQIAAFIGGPSQQSSIFSFILSALLTIFIFTLLVKLSSRVYVQTFFVLLCGAVFFGLLLIIGKLYGAYLAIYFQQVDDLYGGLSAFFVLLTWIYLLCVSFLLTLELLKLLVLVKTKGIRLAKFFNK